MVESRTAEPAATRQPRAAGYEPPQAGTQLRQPGTIRSQPFVAEAAWLRRAYASRRRRIEERQAAAPVSLTEGSVAPE